MRNFDRLGIRLLGRWPAAVLHGGAVQHIDWTRAPYTISCSGQRTDWTVQIARGAVDLRLGEAPRAAQPEDDRLQLCLWITPRTLKQDPFTLPPTIHRIGSEEWALWFYGARDYSGPEGDWFGSGPTPS